MIVNDDPFVPKKNVGQWWHLFQTAKEFQVEEAVDICSCFALMDVENSLNCCQIGNCHALSVYDASKYQYVAEIANALHGLLRFMQHDSYYDDLNPSPAVVLCHSMILLHDEYYDDVNRSPAEVVCHPMILLHEAYSDVGIAHPVVFDIYPCFHCLEMTFV